jgi:myo-inositol-1(or 4)-monophosphatase
MVGMYSYLRRTEGLSKELEAAISAAKEAGEVLVGAFGREQAVRHKGEVNIVTEADERAEAVIKETLLGAFPTYGMLAEEGGGLAGEVDARWIVDPLDGTTNYAHGLPIFCVSVALEREGKVVLGVVHDPMREETFVAERGNGATLNGEPVRVSATDEMIAALVVTGFPYDRREGAGGSGPLRALAALTRSMRRLGSAALDLCYVASGRLDGYYERGAQAWDVAAGALIVEEAGGRVTDYRGGALELAGGEVVASNGRLHPAMIELTGEYGQRESA